MTQSNRHFNVYESNPLFTFHHSQCNFRKEFLMTDLFDADKYLCRHNTATFTLTD